MHGFDDVDVGKQQVALKEDCAEYWLKEILENIGRCPGQRDRNELILKMTLTALSWFSMTLGKRTFGNIVGKMEKMLVTSIFSFSQNVFYLCQNKFLFLGYIYCVVCKCFEFRPVQNVIVW